DQVVYTDPALLERILRNYISNAIRYTEAGVVAVETAARDGALLIDVVDTGIGIPAAHHREICGARACACCSRAVDARRWSRAARGRRRGARESPGGPDAIIADYRLRDGRTGIQTIERVQRERGRTIPALIVTGDTAVDRLRVVKASGYP